MLRRSLDWLLEQASSHSKLRSLHPLISGIDHFLYAPKEKTVYPPYIRDSVDTKRWMMLVVLSLMPCTLMAIWNSGLYQFVYGGADLTLVKEYLTASLSLQGYLSFVLTDGRPFLIIKEGLMIFLPILLTSYLVGGIWEIIFACTRGHPIKEGFLVTGILFPLILPSTIPLWMVALGVSFGIIFAKEVFGGTGMNIINPALACRAFLFFAFPAQMTGDVWVGKERFSIQKSLQEMNQIVGFHPTDAISQETLLSTLSLGYEIKEIQTDAIANYRFHKTNKSLPLIKEQLSKWKQETAELFTLTEEEFQKFITAPFSQGGLSLPLDNYVSAVKLVDLKEGRGLASPTALFFGNRMGSLGETSILACLLGALFLLITRIASWELMLATSLGAFFTALFFEWGGSTLFFSPFNPSSFTLPAYTHFLLGGLAFGIVFMATDPVTAPTFLFAKWLYGILIGSLTILIRLINPAFPEGVMLAILFANVFSPLFDQLALKLHIATHARNR